MLVNDVEMGMPAGVEIAAIGPLNLSGMRCPDAIELIRSAVLLRKPLDIAICNAHTMLLALDDPEYAATLKKMTLLNDGIGANLANLILNGRSFADNLNGTDFVPTLLEQIGIPLRIYLLGAKEDQLQKTAARISEAYPAHTVVGSRNGYFNDNDIPQICKDINDARPDLLLVAMGNPIQEKFIVENRQHLTAGVAIGVGALFDFMSGSVPRAPKIIRSLRLEWLFRLLREPKRLSHRYVIGGPRFILEILRLKLRLRSLDRQ